MSLTLVISDCDSIVSQNAAMRAKGRTAALSDLQSELREREVRILGEMTSQVTITLFTTSQMVMCHQSLASSSIATLK